MAATTRVILQAVRPRAPLIKFPNRLGIPRPNVQEAVKMAVPAQSSGTHSLPQLAGANIGSPKTAEHSPPSRVTSTPDTAASIKDLPHRYRRKALAAEEIDYIQRGGPE